MDKTVGREKAPTRTRRPKREGVRRNAIRSTAKGSAAIVVVAMVLGTYVLPAYATAVEPVALATSAPVGEVQSLRVPSGDSTEGSSISRDSFSIVKTIPDAAPFSRTADTFANNPNSPIQWPLAQGAPISSWFGQRDCEGCPTFHKGIDINPGMGTPVQAIFDGVVIESAELTADYGTYVLISHVIDGQVIVSRYAHMIEGSSPLRVGDRVTAGTLVGQVGSTGLSTGAHLHFEILLDGTTPTDPYVWMKEKIGS
jgi:murein DD-endopeptidase MepM/ murein hydrolase activator NlpD